MGWRHHVAPSATSWEDSVTFVGFLPAKHSEAEPHLGKIPDKPNWRGLMTQLTHIPQTVKVTEDCGWLRNWFTVKKTEVSLQWNATRDHGLDPEPENLPFLLQQDHENWQNVTLGTPFYGCTLELSKSGNRKTAHWCEPMGSPGRNRSSGKETIRKARLPCPIQSPCPAQHWLVGTLDSSPDLSGPIPIRFFWGTRQSPHG